MKSTSVSLAECTPEFAGAWLDWRRQPLAVAYMPLQSATVADLASRIQASSNDLHDRTAVRYMWCVQVRGEPAGMVGLTSVSWSMGYAEITYIVDPRFHCQGVATSAVAQMIDRVFGETPLHRLFATVSAGHEASIRVLQKLGFREEGRLREHFLIGGRRVDQLIFGLLRPEWKGFSGYRGESS